MIIQIWLARFAELAVSPILLWCTSWCAASGSMGHKEEPVEEDMPLKMLWW